MRVKLKSVFLYIKQRVIYSIFQELVNYLKINKPERYEKSITNIFANVQMLIK